jgi:hypothetical protein
MFPIVGQAFKETYVKRFSQMWLVAITCLLAVAAQAQKAQKAVVVNEIKHDVSLPLRDMAKLTQPGDTRHKRRVALY